MLGFVNEEANDLFNNTFNTFYLRLHGISHMVKDHLDSERGSPLPPHRLLFPISSKVFLYAPSHRQDNTYHGLCYTSRGALAGTRNSWMGQPWRIDPTTHRTMSKRSYHRATSRSLVNEIKNAPQDSVFKIPSTDRFEMNRDTREY